MHLLTSFNAEAKNNSVILPKLGLEAGTYYISVTNRQYTCDIEYIIANTFSATSTWETEFNNSYSTSDELKINQYIEGCIGEGSFSDSDNADYDYYRINIPNTGKLKISVYNTSENIDKYVFWNIEIYKFSNGSYNKLASERVDANNTPYSFPTLSVMNGVYYVVVKNSQYAKEVNYKIINTFECNHSYESIVLKNPNCTSFGEKRCVCKYCGNTYNETISPLGHTYDNGVVIKTANCSENGIKKYTCIICGNIKNETILSTSHNYVRINRVAPTCTEMGYENYECAFCGDKYTSEYISPTGHDYSHYSIIKYATCTTTGIKTITCSICGETKTETISAVGHSFGYNSSACSVCGAVNPNYVAPQPSKPTKPTNPTIPTQPAQPTTPTAPVSNAPVQPAVTTPTEQAPSGAKKVNGEWVAKKQKNAKIRKLTKAKKSFKATWKKVSGVTGYQVQYSTTKKFTKKTTKSVTIKKNKTTSKTVKKLKAKKKYYIRIRTYKNVKLNGKTVKVYSTWSKAKTVKTK